MLTPPRCCCSPPQLRSASPHCHPLRASTSLMPIDEVKAGMRGKGVTVFAGRHPQRVRRRDPRRPRQRRRAAPQPHSRSAVGPAARRDRRDAGHERQPRLRGRAADRRRLLFARVVLEGADRRHHANCRDDRRDQLGGSGPARRGARRRRWRCGGRRRATTSSRRCARRSPACAPPGRPGRHVSPGSTCRRSPRVPAGAMLAAHRHALHHVGLLGRHRRRRSPPCSAASASRAGLGPGTRATPRRLSNRSAPGRCRRRQPDQRRSRRSAPRARSRTWTASRVYAFGHPVLQSRADRVPDDEGVGADAAAEPVRVGQARGDWRRHRHGPAGSRDGHRRHARTQARIWCPVSLTLVGRARAGPHVPLRHREGPALHAAPDLRVDRQHAAVVRARVRRRHLHRARQDDRARSRRGRARGHLHRRNAGASAPPPTSRAR